MDPNRYQDATKTTEIYTNAAGGFLQQYWANEEGLDSPDDINQEDQITMLSVMYCAGKLNGEAGEVAEIVFKAFRGGELTDSDKDKLFYELGDIMWYVARLADLCGHRLADVMLANIEKLQDRQRRGVLHGYGDNR